MSAEVLKSSIDFSGPDFLRTKQFFFVTNTDVVDNIELGVRTEEQGENTTSSLAALATKSIKEQSINLICFDKFSSFQKLLRVTAIMLRLLPSFKNYRTVDGRTIDRVELDEIERHLHYFVQNTLVLKERNFLTNKTVKNSSLLSLHCFSGHMVSFVLLVESDGLIRSSGRIRRPLEIDFDTKHPIVLDASHTFVKLFL